MEIKFNGRHVSQKLNAWIHNEHDKACDPTSLGVTAAMRQYLTNRLERAFLAGVEAAEEIFKESTTHTQYKEPVPNQPQGAQGRG